MEQKVFALAVGCMMYDTCRKGGLKAASDWVWQCEGNRHAGSLEPNVTHAVQRPAEGVWEGSGVAWRACLRHDPQTGPRVGARPMQTHSIRAGIALSFDTLAAGMSLCGFCVLRSMAWG